MCIYLTHLNVRYSLPTRGDIPKTLRGILPRLDLLGCLLLGGWIGAAITAISLVTSSTHDEYTWSSPTVIGLLSAAGGILLFLVVWEVWIVTYPVVPVELLSKRTPIAVAINNLTTAALSFCTVRRAIRTLIQI